MNSCVPRPELRLVALTLAAAGYAASCAVSRPTGVSSDGQALTQTVADAQVVDASTTAVKHVSVQSNANIVTGPTNLSDSAVAVRTTLTTSITIPVAPDRSNVPPTVIPVLLTPTVLPTNLVYVTLVKEGPGAGFTLQVDKQPTSELGINVGCTAYYTWPGSVERTVVGVPESSTFTLVFPDRPANDEKAVVRFEFLFESSTNDRLTITRQTGSVTIALQTPRWWEVTTGVVFVGDLKNFVVPLQIAICPFDSQGCSREPVALAGARPLSSWLSSVSLDLGIRVQTLGTPDPRNAGPLHFLLGASWNPFYFVRASGGAYIYEDAVSKKAEVTGYVGIGVNIQQAVEFLGALNLGAPKFFATSN